jgi:UDP-4-amino-4-deoxy-L-arabinose-oxoglutarate aminotransferase
MQRLEITEKDPSMNKVDFYRHGLGQEEAEAVKDVLDTLFLTTGPVCARLENALVDYLNAGHAVSVSTGTAALELALKALDIGDGDEVITTPMTFIATSNACLYVGAKPVFVDVEPDTGNLDAALVEAAITPRTKALLPVHLYGAMCDVRALRDICDRHGLKLISDCAHALESKRDGLGSADLVDAACYSFYATKNLSCGEGGAIVTPHAEVAERLKSLRTHGMSKGAADRYSGSYQHWDMIELGRKANLPDLLAALLLPQIPKLDGLLARREAIANRYEKSFSAMPEVDFPKVPEGSVSGRHLFTIWVPRRDEFIQGLQERGIGVAVNYRAVHLLSYYQKSFGFKPGDFPNAEYIGDRTISLPMYPGLSDREVEQVIQAVSDTARSMGA